MELKKFHGTIMEYSHYVTIGIFLTTQLISLVAVIVTTKGDVKMLKSNIGGVQKELEKLSNVLVAMANFKGEINLINERMLAQGKRLDEEINRSNQWRDSRDDASCPAHNNKSR